MTRFALIALMALSLVSGTAAGSAPQSSAARSEPLPLPGPTRIRDGSAVVKLSGNSGISLQWISWERRGHLSVGWQGETLFLNGYQKDTSGPGTLSITGYVTEIDAHRFRFHGRIVIEDTPDIGRKCVRDGDFTFAITRNRKYWRLQEMERCDGLTDYVDIFF